MDWNGKQVRLSPEEVEVSSLEVLIVKGERKHRAEIYKVVTFVKLLHIKPDDHLYEQNQDEENQVPV